MVCVPPTSTVNIIGKQRVFQSRAATYWHASRFLQYNTYRQPRRTNERCVAAGTAAVDGNSTPQQRSPTDWNARLMNRSVEEIVESGRKFNKSVDAVSIEAGVEQLAALLPGPPKFVPNLHAMKASDWAKVLMDPQPVGRCLVQLKMHFPGMNVSSVISRRPYLLLMSAEQIDKDAAAVKKLLATANDMDKILEQVPELLIPKFLLSALVTINKWYRMERDPIEVLENDPELIYRAQTMDQAFEPVYEDKDGNFEAPQYNYTERRTDWQAHIDKTRFNGAPGPVVL